jgi:hypothetical protein
MIWKTWLTTMLAALVVTGLTPMATPGLATAEEAKTPIAPMILDLVSPPIESYDAAFNQAMRESGPSPRRSALDGKVLPDGSVQYGDGPGSVIVTVKNPCPEGSGHYEPPPLPGRRVRK